MSCAISTTLKKYCSSSSAEVAVAKTKTILYHSVKDIDVNAWSELVHRSNRFLCLDYLTALEESHDNGLELRYVLFTENDIPIGAAAFQITHFITSDDAYSNVFLKTINNFLKFFRGRHVHNILICGNAIATGEHGFTFKNSTDSKAICALLVGAMKEVAGEEQKRGKRICAMVIKDFYPNSLEIAEEFKLARFKTFQVDHNMVMPLLPEWQNLNDYLDSMNTKFRTKAKAALKRSDALEIIDRNEKNIQEIIPQLNDLYTKVHEKADFRLGKLDLNALPLLVSHLPNNFIIRTYSLHGKIVGFITAMTCGNTLEAHVIGIDYDVNRDFAVYQRMLYDYVDLAIQRRCERIVFGRTAAEIKSSIGAFPVDLTCCVLHQRRISNALLSLIVNYVKPSEYPQRQPYKSEVLEKISNEKLF
jgi:predicted N-acyltransferase